MAPEQCPSCGRFLPGSFVAEATPGPRPCPRCGGPVSFAGGDEQEPVASADAPEVPAVADEPAETTEVTPTPVIAGALTGATDPADAHPLDAWGSGAVAPPLTDERPAPVSPEDLGLVAGGALLGALVVRRARLLGALVGATAAAVSLLVRRS